MTCPDSAADFPRFLQGELFSEYAPMSLAPVFRRGIAVDTAARLRRPEQFLVFPQQAPYSCGSACLRMVLQYFWIVAGEEYVRTVGGESERHLRSLESGQTFKSEDQGIGSTGTMAVLRHFRLRGFIMKGEHSGLEHLAWLLSRDVPVIVNWQCEHDGLMHPAAEQPLVLDEELFPGAAAPRAGTAGMDGHYSVAVALTEGRRHVLLADPSGNVFMAEAGWFERRWWDPTPKHFRWMVAAYRDRELNRDMRRLFRGLFV